MSYKYSHRLPAPSVVEFYCTQPQGHRVVRIYLDSYNPRIEAFNESSFKRSPATLTLKEIHDLVDEAMSIINPDRFKDDSFPIIPERNTQ